MTTSGNFTIGTALSCALEKLSESGNSSTPRLDCEVLLGHLLNCARIDLILNKDKCLSRDECDAFFAMIDRRIKNEPVSYITHLKEFMSLEFIVDKGVLIPRPETELLVEFIIKEYREKEAATILDLCTGSGAIAVSLAYYLKNARLTAVDKFDVCINTAKINAEHHAVSDRVVLLKADILNKFQLNQKFNCIVSNPPYIKKSDFSTLPPDVKDFEPEYALDGGEDGLLFYRQITSFAAENLLPDGNLVFEIGCDQGLSVKKIIEKSGCFHSVTITKDYAGLDRMITAVKGD